MDIKLLCKDENQAAIKNILAANGIGIDVAAELIMVEKGLDHEIESEIKIVFTMHALSYLIEFLKSAGSNGKPVNMLIGKRDEAYRPINVGDVAYINAINNNVYINDVKQKQFVIKPKLYQLEHMILPDYFIRINKSEIVNIKRITMIVPMFKGKLIIYLEGYKNPLDISRNYTKAFKERLGLS